MKTSDIHVVVPNHSNAFLLRVYRDSVERLPIIAWRIVVEIELRPARDWTFVYPISIDEKSDDCLEVIASGLGSFTWLDSCSWDTETEAIAYCQAELAKPRG